MQSLSAAARLRLAAAGLALAFAAIYLPAAGHGFVKDDFGWVARSRIHGAGDAAKLFVTAPTGFYRPIVSLSFGLTRPICGSSPKAHSASPHGPARSSLIQIQRTTQRW